MAERYQPKAFVCQKCGLVLGEYYREAGRRVTQLRTYRVPRSVHLGLWDGHGVEALTFHQVETSDTQVLCFCGQRNGFYANQDLANKIVENVRNFQKGS